MRTFLNMYCAFKKFLVIFFFVDHTYEYIGLIRTLESLLLFFFSFVDLEELKIGFERAWRMDKKYPLLKTTQEISFKMMPKLNKINFPWWV